MSIMWADVDNEVRNSDEKLFRERDSFKEMHHCELMDFLVKHYHCEDKGNMTSLTNKYRHHMKEIELSRKI